MSSTARPARRVHIIGIGAGSPDHVTGQAISAMREVDIFLVADKGETKDELVAVRRAICERFLEDGTYEIVTVMDPQRGPDAQRDSAAYKVGVDAWHRARAERYTDVVDALPEGAAVGFLVWGDPAFYDSTIRIVEAIAERGAIEVEYDVVPGISALQLLAARHRIVLHDVG